MYCQPPAVIVISTLFRSLPRKRRSRRDMEDWPLALLMAVLQGSSSVWSGLKTGGGEDVGDEVDLLDANETTTRSLFLPLTIVLGTCTNQSLESHHDLSSTVVYSKL